MPQEKFSDFDVAAEIDRLFDDSSIASDSKPIAVIFMGGPAAGKTTLRKQKYSSGYVLIDAADIFLSLSRGESFDFPDAFQQQMALIGRLVAHRALSERRNIVTEIIGIDAEATQQLIEAVKSAGYSVKLAAIECGMEEAMRRNASRGEDNISAYYAEPFQRSWIIDACDQIQKTR